MFNKTNDDEIMSFVHEELKCDILEESHGGTSARVYKVLKPNSQIAYLKIANAQSTGDGAGKLRSQIQMLLNTAAFLKEQGLSHLHPAIRGYDMESDTVYIFSEEANGRNLSDIFFSEEQGDTIVETLDSLLEVLNETYALSSIPNTSELFDDLYETKARNRFASMVEEGKRHHGAFGDLQNYEHIFINGIKMLNPLDIFDSLNSMGRMQRLQSETLGFCICGDPILDNVFFDGESFCFIDPAPNVTLSEEGTGSDLNLPYFDFSYDASKIFVFFSGWKQIIRNEFELEADDFSFKNGSAYNLKLGGDFKEKFESVQASLITQVYTHMAEQHGHQEAEKLIERLCYATAMSFLREGGVRIHSTDSNNVQQAMADYLIGCVMINKYYGSVKQGKTFGPKVGTDIFFWQEQ